MIVDTTDRYYKEIFDHLCYDIVPYPKEAVIVDIGANKGIFSLWASDKAEKIYAIEPHPPTFAKLKKTIAANSLTNVQAYECAIAGSTGTALLTSDGQDGGNSITYEYDNGQIKVKAVTLADFFKQERINHVDIIKIDVEGAEQAIFEAPDFHEIASQIDVIIGELHGGNVLKDVLESEGFTYTHGSIFVAERKK